VFWAALTVFIVAPLAALVYAIVQGLGAWRAFRRFAAALGGGTGELAARLDAMASREPFEAERMTASFDRLGRATAQLSILLNALGRVRTQWSSLLAVYPRK
jgi:hypothetical protein